MNTNQQMRWWLSTGAVTAGVGAALLAGAGAADADTGDTGTGRSDTSERATKSTSNSAASAEKSSESPTQRKSSKREPVSVPDREDKPDSVGVRAARDESAQSSGGAGDVTKQSAKPRANPVQRNESDPEQELVLPAASTSPVAVKAYAGPVVQRLAPAANLTTATLPVTAASPSPRAVAAAVVVAPPGKSNLQVAPGVSVDADWYFPNSGPPAGLILLQHGNLRGNENFKALATALSQQTNSVVVAPTFQSSSLFYPQYYLNGEGTQSGVAALFNGNRTALTASAAAAGYVGALPKSYVLAGHSFGGQMVTVVGDYRKSDPNLKGVLLLDAVNQNAEMAQSLARIPASVPVYQIAAEPAGFNLRDSGTKVLAKARPGRFIGVRIVGGTHLDAEGSSTSFFAALAAGFPKARNAAALQVLAAGYINDMYNALGPTSPGRSGVYSVAGLQVSVGQAKVVRLG
jgi:hypothetical protein